MKLTKRLINRAWIPAVLSAVVLLTGCESTQVKKSAEGYNSNYPSREVKGYSQTAHGREGGQRPASAPAQATATKSAAGDIVYEDHLVRVEKIYKSGSTVGAPFNYDIIVKAKRAITNVEIDEILPDTIKYQDSSPKASMNQFGMPSWDLQAFDAGDEMKINVTVVPQKVGSYKVCSVVRADPLICLPLFIGQPELQITKTGPARVEMGESATWDIMVKNTGSAIADNVVITDTMPSGFTAVGPVSKNVGSLQPGGNATFKVTGKSNKVGKFVNTAVANYTGGTPVQATAPIEVVQSAVAITKTGPATGFIFVDETYTITVTNKGNTTLRNLTVTDQLPVGAVLEGKVVGSGEVADVDTGRTVFIGPKYDARRAVWGYWREGSQNPLTDDHADQITWKIDSLAAGASKSFKVTFYANKPSTTVNNATVKTERGLTDKASATTVWKAVPGVHTGIRDSIDPIQVGQDTILTVNAENQSGYDTFTVTSQVVTVGDGLTVKSVSSGGTINGNVVSFPPVNLGPGKEVTRTITVTGSKPGTTTSKMETMTNFRDTPVLDQESTTIY
ncbi:DUF7507 domain-containing protein [Rubellicoccus peritrichatus]|uniref:DUF11 domain-containing protein n=1 Tax=Rubellicoccus peritrichatus TaxID=3080537 RepID=A0AAQ3LBB6_9BACT|nr:hypothetical protein [Puniceicoccus sp. CR14]WOO40333.1 hypothetical protein RZN69_17070 [Puniceicoccus sp. CR14]